MGVYWTLLKALPDLLKLLRAIEKGIDESKTQRKVGDDIKKISEAFDEKDPTKLRAIFNN